MEGLKTNVEHDVPVQGLKHRNVAGMGSSMVSPSPDKFERFEKWLRENGAQFDMVSCVCSLKCWDLFLHCIVFLSQAVGKIWYSTAWRNFVYNI